jgi:hypothetical protein
MRNAVTSPPLPGDPVDTTLPLRSSSVLIELDASVTTCVVDVQNGERAKGQRRPVECVAAVARVGQRVAGCKGEIYFVIAEKLQIVDRGGGDLGCGFHVRNRVRDHLGDPAAVGIEDPAGSAGGDRQTGAGRALAARRQQGEHERRRRSCGGAGAPGIVRPNRHRGPQRRRCADYMRATIAEPSGYGMIHSI